MFPILPLSLSIEKPKHNKYPREILTIGNEIRKMRMDRKLIQHQVAKQLNVNKNFIYELEANKKTQTIFVLHKTYLFLGYIPKTVKIDKITLQGKLFIHRIKNNLTYTKLAKQMDLDKSTLARVEKGKICKAETFFLIEKHLT